MSQRPVRLGMIGCGAYAQRVLVPSIRESGATLGGVWNRTRSKAAELVRAGAKGFSDWREMVNDPGTDAVVCALPPTFNAVVLRACETAGKPVWIEKPVASSVEDLALVEQVVRRSRVHVQVGTQLLHSSWWSALLQTLPQVGDLLAVNARICVSDDWAFEPLTWKIDRESSGGVLNSWGVHPLTMLLHLAGGFDAQYADLTVFSGTGFDRQGVDPSMYDTLCCSWITTRPGGDLAVPSHLQLSVQPQLKSKSWTMEVLGSEGRIEADFYARTVTLYPRTDSPRKIEVPPYTSPGHDGNTQAMHHFVDLVTRKQTDNHPARLALTACRFALEINVDPQGDEADLDEGEPTPPHPAPRQQQRDSTPRRDAPPLRRGPRR